MGLFIIHLDLDKNVSHLDWRLKDAITLMVLEDDMDVFDLVVSAMTRFQTSGEIQFYGCKSLQLLLEHGKGAAQVHLALRYN